MDEIMVGALGPTPRSLVELFRENANRVSVDLVTRLNCQSF